MAKKKMSAAHKEALAKGREQGRIVREYLAALDQPKKPGRKISPEEAAKRAKDLQNRIDAEADPVTRIELIQKRLDMEDRAATATNEPDLEALQKQFIKVAKDYGERRGITYSAWREAGVPAAVLKEAGVPRTRRAA